ncbi:MAG: DNA-directed RNA polymerase subunit beta [Candidatus Delongbacteria bacterium]
MKAKNHIQRHTFSRIPKLVELPDLLDIQLASFRRFIQLGVRPEERERVGLNSVFLNVFPIIDNREEHILEFSHYAIEPPKYTVEECKERGVTFAAPLKALLRLSRKTATEDGFGETIEQEVYLGNLPMMTDTGTFIINGSERVIVSQLHRSPGVFFGVTQHQNGTPLYAARIIPFRGSWVEFTTDINDVLYVYIDRRKKFPVTTLLRAMGYASNAQIFNLFGYSEEVALSSKTVSRFVKRQIIDDVVDESTGEIVVERGTILSEENLALLKDRGVKSILLLRDSEEHSTGFDIMRNTLGKDSCRSQEDALMEIYRELRGSEAPDLDTAKGLLEKLFFDERRYDLGAVGRYRMNAKLNLDIPRHVCILTIEDLTCIITYVLELREGKRMTDDIDHLGNRRVRTVGEQLANQFSVALTRMARTIKERMNLHDTERLTPQDLINVRTVSSVVNTFFGTNQLSQFMDQVNPLAELTHKRRLSALGPGGLTRERAGFEVRDVHFTHYGRLCPIETPEGPNIGLISSLCTYARINDLGFVETPYRRVKEGRATRIIEYLSADDEDHHTIAQADVPLDDKGAFTDSVVKARYRAEYPVVSPGEVSYMDVSPDQIVSVAASLIPFLEHDDANRALMGSNMQRQAVPLLRPQAPIVGTGMERKSAVDSRAVVTADIAGLVTYVDSDRIEVTPTHKARIPSRLAQRTRVYGLRKFERSNQDTCVNQKPLVNLGDKVKKGDILADGCATEMGDLALGRNVLVAFMPWNGYNFEDSIILSEKMVATDVFTSIHITEEVLEVRETKRGEEELTNEIPNVSEEATRDLDENGIIRVGAKVQPGSIIIGKVTPKGEMESSPEDKLLKAIFGDKAGDVKDASKVVGPGGKGVIIDTKLFSRKKKDPKAKRNEKKLLDDVDLALKEDLQILRHALEADLKDLLVNQVAGEIRDQATGKLRLKPGTTITEKHILKLDLDDLDTGAWTDDEQINSEVESIINNYKVQKEILGTDARNKRHKIEVGDELPAGIVQIAKVYIAQKRKIQIGDKMAGRHGNKGVVGKVVPMEDMPFLADGTPVDIVLNPLGVPSRMNLGQVFETALGWAGHKLGKYYATPVFDGAGLDDVIAQLDEAGLPTSGKIQLYDGKTGAPFDQPVTVGMIYIIKLNHLVDDKIHARSIGPYSLITQQPLGGKAQFGGQRFGEMEVWALEAYGAANILQEILTVKSDDVQGRTATYEAIVKGLNLPQPGVPESFNVLIHELKGLGLNIPEFAKTQFFF